MRRTVLTVFAIALAAAAGTVEAAAQDSPLLLEVGGGAAIPLQGFADGDGTGEGTSTGASFALAFVMSPGGWRSYYGGFAQHRFGCEAAGCAPGGEYVATGFALGVRINLVQGHAAVPWIRLGGITTRVETGDLPAPDAGVSKLGIGAEVGTGVYLGSERIGVQPSVVLSSVTSKLPGGASLGLRYLTAHLALVLPF